ncbi:methyltransferase domain-containing protein [Solihabitans fulvus]|uniref:Methyltransferase domain-containing protein n=2 Tax=Solihabitans fulvus TaxID=1892852 RepID=A0A5B2XRW0_9PSEU|nr:methyltransferase domain-containing protein [Solihabitans fulvus]
MFRAMLATQESFTAYLGAKLGLYRALHDHGPATVAQLAARTGLHHRYLREWLEQQASSGLLACDAADRPWPLRIYRLPPGHERVLIASDDALSLTSAAFLPVGGIAGALPSLLAAFRTGGGLSAEVFGADWRDGHGGANRAIYTHELVGWLGRHLPDVASRLSDGPSHIADIGCGAGWASISLARAHPRARVSAVDLDADAVAQARAHVQAAGLATRIDVRTLDAADLAGGDLFDLVCLFDVVHELAQPVPVLRVCRRLLAPTGTVLVLDSRVADAFHAPGDEIERFQYATSVLHCLPAGLAGDAAVGTGTVMRQGTVRGYAASSGFADVRSYDLDDRLHRLYRLEE